MDKLPIEVRKALYDVLTERSKEQEQNFNTYDDTMLFPNDDEEQPLYENKLEFIDLTTNNKDEQQQSISKHYINQYKNDATMKQVGQDIQSDDEHTTMTVRSGNKWCKVKVKRTS